MMRGPRCHFPGCANVAYTKGLCHPHYNETRKKDDWFAGRDLEEAPEEERRIVPDKTHEYRIERLGMLGFTDAEAHLLAADRGVDIHRAEYIIKEKQCPPSVAFDILR